MSPSYVKESNPTLHVKTRISMDVLRMSGAKTNIEYIRRNTALQKKKRIRK
jgi:hypothetical protein